MSETPDIDFTKQHYVVNPRADIYKICMCQCVFRFTVPDRISEKRFFINLATKKQ